MSIVTLAGDVRKHGGFALVGGMDMSSVLTLLVESLGRKVLVEGINDTESNAEGNLTILAVAAQDFIMRELQKRGSGHDGAPVLKHHGTLSSQG